MRNMTTTTAFLIALAMMGTGVASATESTRWLNVHVTDLEEGANIQVHLPLNLVLAVLRAVDVENFHGGKVELEVNDADIDWPTIFSAVKEAPDGEFVKVDSPDADVLVSKQAGSILIDVTESEHDQAKVKITVPASLVDALVVDEQNRVDLVALLDAFDRLPEGDLVTVDSPDANVRVWIE